MQIKTNHKDEFVYRHNSPMRKDTEAMLKTIGVSSIDQLIDETIPAHIRLKERMKLPAALTEMELLSMLKSISENNKIYKNFIGQGYYGSYTPNVVLRNIFENPNWYTAYTPYQPEIAQGRLEALLNYQTMIIDLTGMEIANASLLDEATAAAEAMSLLHAESKSENENKFFVSELCFKQTIDVLITRAEPTGIEIVIGNHETAQLDNTYFGAMIQYPASNGEIFDYSNSCQMPRKTIFW
jgi:glycine dehydrogenase